MNAQVKLGRIAGISIGLHYSWLLIALLIALSLGKHFRSVAPEWNSTVVWTAAVTARNGSQSTDASPVFRRAIPPDQHF